MSIVRTLQNRYGTEAVQVFRKYERLKTKEIKTNNDIRFLEICSAADIVPKFVRFKVANKNLRRECESVQKRFLIAEIKHKKRNLLKISNEAVSLRFKLSCLVSRIDLCCLEKVVFLTVTRESKRQKLTHEKKEKSLRAEKKLLSSCFSGEEVIFNYSDYVLSEVEKSALSKGLQFCLPPGKLKYGDYLANFERLFEQSDSRLLKERDLGQYNLFHSELKEIALSSFYAHNKRARSLNLPREEYLALKKLSGNSDLVIVRPDKGSGVVVLNKTDYVRKMNSVLEDTSKFEWMQDLDGFSLVRKLEQNMRKLLLSLKKRKFLSSDLYERLYPNGSSVGRLYGLPKVHKEGVPLRPILSAVGTHNHAVAKYLAELINPVSNSKGKHSASDTFDFISRISSLDISDKYMVSFDVTSLFTNVPIAEVVDICCERLYHVDHDHKPAIPEKDFRKLLLMCVNGSYFLFDGKLFKQTDGVAMGSPLGPVLANIFLAHLEDTVICDSQLFPEFYVRYVDDTFCVFTNRSDVQPFLDFINSVHPNLKFTMEEEVDNKLPFLDTCVERKEHEIELSVHRKSVFKGLYFHFASYIPSSYKSGLIKTIVCRSFRICSTWKRFAVEMEAVTDFLKKNAFPMHVIYGNIRDFLNGMYASRKLPTFDVPKKKCRLVLPFLGPESFRLKSKIKKAFSVLAHIDVQVIFASNNRIQNLFRVKDRIPTAWTSHCVYQIRCQACNACYIGKTVNTIRERFLVGKETAHLHPENLKSPLNVHLQDNAGHSFSFDDVKILDRSSDKDLLFIKESLYILSERPELNRNIGTRPIYLF